MAITVVDLSQTSKRIATPTLDHDLILSNTAAAIGVRAGVVSLEVIKNFIGGGGVTVSASAPSSPSAGNLWWDTSGNPDAGLKIRIGIRVAVGRHRDTHAPRRGHAGPSRGRHRNRNTSLVSAQGGSGHRCA